MDDNDTTVSEASAAMAEAGAAAGIPAASKQMSETALGLAEQFLGAYTQALRAVGVPISAANAAAVMHRACIGVLIGIDREAACDFASASAASLRAATDNVRPLYLDAQRALGAALTRLVLIEDAAARVADGVATDA